MASAYLVELNLNIPGQGFQDKKNAVIVYANDTTEAKNVAKLAMKWDANAPWADSNYVTVTALAAPTDWFTPHVWNFRVQLRKPTGQTVYDVTVQADNTNKTIDTIAALLVTALEAQGGTALTPSYNSTTQVLKVAAVADGIGDYKLTCTLWPTLTGGDVTPSINSSSFFGAIVDGGVAAADVTVTLAADATVPTLAFYKAVTTR